ncbi:MAG: Na(+)-translocating NADH-quinone reductase subunit A [Acidobacteria bacterium]|nr:Na(+)-translocating NADH-quinone reductase subunit A [Acidobacteriota bacterium]
MGLHSFRKGLRLPLAGAPVQEIETVPEPRHVALVAADAVGLRPAMHVAVGDEVRRGQLLFEDKTLPGVRYTAPAAGRVAAVNRGARRALQSVVIELSRAEREGRGPDEAAYSAFTGRHPSGMAADDVRALLLESGLWTALRARPFGRVADPAARPHSIFVTATDTQPHAPAPAAVIGRGEAFERGVAALCRLTDGPVYVCTDPDTDVQLPANDQVRHEQFSGPHPAGTVGLHIHTLDPVDRRKTVWHAGAQDVAAIGALFRTGTLDVTRVVALAGPLVRRPRLLRTRLGAALDDLVRGELHDGEARVISGSVLSGRTAAGPVHGYLGRYHQQVAVLAEGREREFLGWLSPGLRKFSAVRTFVAGWLPGRQFRMTTSTHGGRRAIVPIGTFERVMPLDLMATALLRALLMGDVDRAEELGCLELDEEDLALCTFVCAGKNDYGPHLRQVLDTLEREG